MKNNRLIINLSSEEAEIAVLSKNNPVESLNLNISGILKGDIIDNEAFAESFQDPKFLRIINTYDFEEIIVGVSPSKISTMKQKKIIYLKKLITKKDKKHCWQKKLMKIIICLIYSYKVKKKLFFLIFKINKDFDAQI